MLLTKTRIISAVLSTLAVAALAFAGVPQTINYQGYITNNGTPVNNVATNVTFSLYSSNPARNNPVWFDTHTVTPVNGIYNVQLGSQKALNAPFDTPYWLGISVGGSALPLQALSSTGYAFRAGVAESVASSGSSSATIMAGGQAVLRIVPTSGSPNIALGSPANVAGGTGVVGATVSGGGDNGSNCWDPVTSAFTRSCANTASAAYATVSGGMDNLSSSNFCTVGGGNQNTAGGGYSTVSGGYGNNAGGNTSTVGGGGSNTAGGNFSTVGGGYANTAGGDYSFAAGRQAKIRDRYTAGAPPYVGDQGTFVWADSQAADFISTGQNQFLVRAAGGVGINKNNPTAALDVNGNANISGTLNLPPNGLAVGTNQIVASGGRVGIGMSSPGYPLDVVGDVQISGIVRAFKDIYFNPNTSATCPPTTIDTQNTGDISFSIPKIASAVGGICSYYTPVNVLTLSNASGTGTATFSGKVGIGTINPDFTLDVNGTGRVTTNFDLSAAGSQIGFNRNSTNGVIYNNTRNAWQMGPSGTNDPFVISAWGTNGALLSYPLVLTTDGKVGIGTSTPKRPLHIAGNASAEINLESTDGLADWKTWNLLVDGAAGGAKNLTFRMLNDAGTASMLNSLVLWNNGNATFAGTVTASVFSPSDIRLKTDIQPLENTLDKVLRLRGVSYVMKADQTRSRKIGVIAQELEREYPELVATDDKGMKSVAYANLTAVLIEAVKGLKAENDALKADNDAMKLRLNRLEKALFGH